MNAGVDAKSRVANALSTANDAIGVIGGLLGNVQSALAVASTATSPEPAGEQTRIDSAITTLDAIASSTRFGGRALLDGTFTAALGAGGPHWIPSFVSSKLGGGSNGNDAALASLTSGGANDLASGNHPTAAQIVTAAIAQVNQTQDSIAGFLSQQTIGAPPVDAPIPPARDSMLLSDPVTAAAAVANTPAQRVLALLSAG